MTLHSQVFGDGPPLVLLHGWGLHGGVFAERLPVLEQHFRCTVIDLPGHGHSPMVAGGLEAWAQACLAVAPAQATWLGWSLGGIVAQAAAVAQPAAVTALLLAATTPRFVAGEGWPHGVATTTAQGFAQKLRSDWRTTVDDFLVLQTLAANNAPGALKALRASVFDGPAPQAEGLATGLNILNTVDLRTPLAALNIPTKVISGALDRLTPPAAGRALATLMDGAFTEVAHAAHTPFLTHPALFDDWVLTP